ncbi:outer membrane biogenesis protein BamB [Planctomycetes bacterium Pan216]|uniref:Outer membrane biogenesis protein BamB n=1 Tax=Kolteria novifilia TaxID=2527975 RepID=A0A518B5E7_9BACT|nr:outer membrane biogenesis protein BamB [Planctomycetes bacterium Pan216]
MRRVLAALALVLTLVGTSLADNWPAWRGPQRDGISKESNPPTTWSKTDNVRWRLPLPGPAGSTPIVWGERIFLTSAEGNATVLLCVDTDGKILWKRPLGEGNKVVRKGEGNSASPSPSTDGQKVWANASTGELACFDFDGNEIWRVDLQDRYGKFDIAFGMTATPVLDGDRLYLQLLHTGGAIVACLDKETGKEIWRQNRESDAYAECEHSYASPIIYRDKDREFLITHGADYVVAHRLDNGEEIWRCGGLNPRGNYNPTLRFVATPAAAPGLIVVPSAKNGPVLGLRPDIKGDVTKDESAYLWTRPNNTPDVPSPLIHDGLVYLCRENGVLLCLDAKTGKELYQNRTHAQRHRASPVFADGKIYITAADGTVTVVKAGPEFEVISSNDIEEPLAASPVIADGTLYLRSYDALYAIEPEEKK